MAPQSLMLIQGNGLRGERGRESTTCIKNNLLDLIKSQDVKTLRVFVCVEQFKCYLDTLLRDASNRGHDRNSKCVWNWVES